MKGEKNIMLKCGPWRKTIEEEEEEKSEKKKREMFTTRKRRTVQCVWAMSSLRGVW